MPTARSIEAARALVEFGDRPLLVVDELRGGRLGERQERFWPGAASISIGGTWRSEDFRRAKSLQAAAPAGWARVRWGYNAFGRRDVNPL